MKNQFANDKEFMLALLAYNGTYLQHSPDALYYASDNLKNDRELLLSALLNKDKINDTYRFDEILDELF
jgi:hypothetical protein